MKKNVLYWVCQTVGWSLHGLFNVFVLLSLFSWNQLSFKPFLVIIISFLFAIFFTHLYRLYIIKNRWLTLGYINLIPKVLIASLFLSVVNFIFRYSITYIFNLSEARNNFSLEKFFFSGVFSIADLLIVYFGWSLIYFLYHYIERQNQSLKDEAALKDFELNKLKSQLNPHFIFNALNSIRALVDEDPVKCKNAINHLSNILRSSLLVDKQKLIPFSEELKTVKDYLALESIRFEERLHTHINITPQTYEYKVPPLMIQTLIENGIKHGISQLKEGGDIVLETLINENKDLIIQIRNSGAFVNDLKSSSGFGIDNTIRRLKLLYGNRASFKIENEFENVVLTEIAIPQSLTN